MIKNFVCNGMKSEKFNPRRVRDFGTIKGSYLGLNIADRIRRVQGGRGWFVSVAGTIIGFSHGGGRRVCFAGTIIGFSHSGGRMGCSRKNRRKKEKGSGQKRISQNRGSDTMKVIMHQKLTVTSEERVLNAILMWALQPNELSNWETVDNMLSNMTPGDLFGTRFQSLNVLLQPVRFALFPMFLLKKMETSNLSLKIPTFSHLVKEAIGFLEAGFPSSGNHPKFQHRQSSFKELQYISDGDSNGVFYYVGTSYGKHQWVNPVLAKKISITASNPISRYTDPKVLASRTYQGTSFAGPRLEDGKNCSWWMVDLGLDHQLMCNYYTVRQDGSKAFMRHWNFQGSSDGKVWTNLRVHEDDQTLSKPGQFASWPVTGPNALLPFRYFRVILTGPTTDDINPWTLCTCFLELYGYFR